MKVNKDEVHIFLGIDSLVIDESTITAQSTPAEKIDNYIISMLPLS